MNSIIQNTVVNFLNGRPVRILHLEDVQDESTLVEQVVRKGGIIYQWRLATSKEDYVDALRNFFPDVILSDHSMPGFSSSEAFRLTKEHNVEVPFILVTATVSEEFAVQAMKDGVADYVLKDRLQRLPAAIENAIDKWDAERENRAFIRRLIRSEANLSAIMENVNVSIYSLDRSLRFVAFNDKVLEMTKAWFRQETKVGDSAIDLINKMPEEHRLMWMNVYKEALSGKSMHFVDELHVYGQRNAIHFHVNPIIESGTVTGVVCFAIDVTSQKVAEENLARSEARFRALTENNFDAIVLGEEPHDVTYASPSLGRMLGYNSDELMRSSVIKFHPEDRPIIEQIYDDARQKPGVPLPAVARVQHRDGHYIWAEGVITNMLDNESVRGIVANYRDVTERKEAEINEAQMTRDLMQRNKDLEQFAYIVSHNLRGPVANILGISNILKQNRASEKDKAEALSGIFIATSKLDEVILDLNRILDTKGKANARKEKVVFQELVDSIAVGIDGVIQKNNVNLVTDFQQVDSILTIRSFLQSIFYNLISNSIKYKQPNVDLVIKITSTRHGSGVRLTFADNGMGIDLTTQGSKVFGLYKRFHPYHAEGKGMGLFMVKTQVESLGGDISIKSEVNKGTEFTIDL